jgi:hypothetical protein
LNNPTPTLNHLISPTPIKRCNEMRLFLGFFKLLRIITKRWCWLSAVSFVLLLLLVAAV